MKKKSLSLLVFVLLIMSTIVLAGCNNTGDISPEDIIRDAYGNNEYNITFSLDTLPEPIPDMKYSAKNIPVLPTPTRTGYIFEGWFFDREYTEPYNDSSLYMKMQDLVLYAKWNKESFTYNGSYDIEYSATIVEGSLKKGALADEYGGYTDLTKCINPINTFIEKSDDKLMLRIEYDSKVVEPFGAKYKVVSIISAIENGTDVFIQDRIDALVTSVKTIFVNITKMDLSKPIYLDVTTHNYGSELLPEDIVAQTYASYKVKFDITKIIGFSESYANINAPLEEGYYLSKSYLRKQNNEDSMAGSFNPVYSYIYSDGHEHYKLIKQNIPYTGLVRPLKDNLTDNYYDRMMSFVPMMVYYDFQTIGHKNTVNSDYYPETYNGGYFREMQIEFHKDTGKQYNIFDLGNRLDKQYMVMMAVTGFMEACDGMGYMNMIMTIDYDTLIKLPTCDYKPLEGEAYTFSDKMQYYAGTTDDLDKKDLIHDSLLNDGFNTHMYNFFYDSNKTMYDSKITITPTQDTNNKKVKESRYEIKHFDISTQIFDYNVKDNKKLFADVSVVQKYSKVGSEQRRKVFEQKNGKSCKEGEVIRFDDEFKYKVNDKVNFSDVTYQAYEMVNSTVDFSKPIFFASPVANFTSDFAVYYEYFVNDIKKTALIEFAKYQAPEVKVINLDNENNINWVNVGNNLYESDFQFKKGEPIKFPQVSYKFMGHHETFVGMFYEAMFGDPEPSIDPTMIVGFETDNSGRLIYCATNSHTDNFTIVANENLLYYELVNIYGEREYIKFKISSSSRNSVEITNTNGDLLFDRGISLDENGKRRPIEASFNGGIIDSFNASLVKDYFFSMPNYKVKMKFSSYSIFTSDVAYENLLVDKSIEEIVNDITAKLFSKPYGYVMLNYTHDEDIFSVVYFYNFTFDGKKSYIINDYATFFTNRTYHFKRASFVGNGGVAISKADFTIDKIVNGRVISGGWQNRAYTIDNSLYQSDIKFLEAGEYLIQYNFYINKGYFANNANGITSVSFFQKVNVVSNKDEVTITYKTDINHPFKDGSLEKTEKYFLDSDIIALSQYMFKNELFEEKYASDILFGWSENGKIWPKNVLQNENIGDFIGKYNNNDVTLYAIWDAQLRIKYNYKNPISNEIILYDEKIVALNKYGYYEIDFELIPDKRLPFGYHNIGWTGGFLKEGINTKKYSFREIPEFSTELEKEQFFTVTAEIRKDIGIRYDIDSAFSNDFLRWDTVMDGFKIENVERKNISSKEGFTFKGWRLATVVDKNGVVSEIATENFDLNSTITLDLVNYKQSTNTTIILVAVFEDGMGGEVWHKEVTP